MKRLLIDDLIQKPSKVDLKVGDREIDVWIRPARDADRNMASALARKESRKLRKALSNKKSQEFQALVKEEYESADPEQLRSIWVNGKLIERAVAIRQASLEDREYIPEPEGEGVTPKQADEYEDAVDDAEDRREEQLKKALETAIKELDEEAKKIPDKELYAFAIPSIVEVHCNRAYEAEFVHQLILRCTFEDKACTRPVFENVDQVYSLKTGPLTRLTNAHVGLLLEPEAVKNLQGGLNPST